MADEEPVFDPTMKKKKKKKKTPFDPEGLGLGGDEPVPEKEEKGEDEMENQKDDVPEITDDFDGDFSNLKKKKKKKKPFDMSEIDNALPSKEESVVEAEPTEDTQPDIGDDLNFDLPTKKKKRKGKGIKFTDEADTEEKDESETSGVPSEGSIWRDTDRDYTYEELLTRVFDIMREKNPEMVAGEKKRFVMKPPQVSKAGAKKTAFANFQEICKMLHRQPKHLLAFLLAELGTSGSVDGSNSLIIKGRFHQKQIETVLRRYIKEYVTCHTCKSPETILQRDTRLYFLQCETCGSRCSVASIKSGFQAVTGKRAAIRAKTT